MMYPLIYISYLISQYIDKLLLTEHCYLQKDQIDLIVNGLILNM